MKPTFPILHLRASNFVGGPEKQLLSQAVLERHGRFEVILAAFLDQQEGHSFLQAAEQRGVSSLAITSRLLGRNNAVSNLLRVIRERRIRLLCTHGYKADLVGTFAARLAGVPVACFLRGWTGEDWKVRSYELLDRGILPCADRVIALSEMQKQRLSRNVLLRGKLRVVPNAVEVPDLTQEKILSSRLRLRRDFGFPNDSPVIGAAGRLSPEKGAFFFIRAIPEILKRHPAARFLIFGDGILREELIALTRRLCVDAQVVCPGFVGNFRDLLPGLDVLVNPSLSEEMPNVVLESMAAGVPVVATDVGGVREIFGTENGCSLIPAGNPEQIARQVLTFLNNPPEARRFSSMARERVGASFSFAHQRECLHALYEEFIKPSSAKGISEHPKPCFQATSRESLTDLRLPFISVVVPARNEERHIGKVLQDLSDQEYPADSYEILVADGNSTDNTKAAVEAVARCCRVPITLLPNPRQLSSSGRNVGVRHSVGELIIFIDAHCHLRSRTLLLDTAQLFRTKNADCLCRPQPLSVPGNTWFQEVVSSVRASFLGHGLDSTIYSMQEGFVNPTSSGACYRRTVFEQIGLYDEKFDACEDVEFNYRVYRAGLPAYTSPVLTVEYSPRDSFKGLWKQMVRYGRGRCRLARVHPEARSISQALPACFLVWIFAAGLVSLVSNRVGALWLASLAVYGAALVSSCAYLAVRSGWRHILAGPAIYITIHFGLGAGFLTEALSVFRKDPILQSPKTAPEKWVPFAAPQVGRDNPTDPQRPTFHSAGIVGVETVRSTEPASPTGPGNRRQSKAPLMNSLTIDVEDYYQTEAMSDNVPRDQWAFMPSRVQANTYRIFEILANHNARGTFFFLGWVAERFPDLVREAVKLGHEVACHSYWHRPVYRLSPEEFREDTLRAKSAIENAAGISVLGYRAPSFSIIEGTAWAFDTLSELGFKYDSSVHPVRHDLYGNPSASRHPHRVGKSAIWELPIATIRLGTNNFPFAGGGYLRLLPYPYVSWCLSRLNNRENRPGIVYLHPWELDPCQPRLPVRFKSRLRQYTGLTTTEGKLRSLIRDFNFGPILQVFGNELNVIPEPEHAGGHEFAQMTVHAP